MTGDLYPSTKYVRRLTAARGWQRELIPDRHGRPVAIVAARVGPRWTDSIAIEGEDRCIAMRHQTRSDSDLIVPSQLPGESGAVWRREGRCEDVLGELLNLPTD
ncbi:MAG: hypothetical protein GEV09_20265 [Pseudonocardiaceae bacterium]|nr:hypothetical protein [Pseudonocardiaceae bacterium]